MQLKNSAAEAGSCTQVGNHSQGTYETLGKQKGGRQRVQHFRTASHLLSSSHFLYQSCYKGLCWPTAFARYEEKLLVVIS